MNKDVKHCFSLFFPRFLTDFIPNLHLTPQGLLCKNGKNDRLVWNGKFLVNGSSKSVIVMMNTNVEPELTYGTVWARHLKRI